MSYKYNPFTGTLDDVGPNNGNGVPSGSDTQVQFNDGGVFGGDSGLTFNKTSNALSAGSFIPSSSTAPTNGVYLPAANSVAISTNGANRLHIASDGKVGLGTSAPNYLFNLAVPAPGLSADTTVAGGQATATNSSRIFEWGLNVTGEASEALNGRSAIQFRLNPGTGGSDSEIRFITNKYGTSRGERMTITSTGSVGIGTTSVTNLLHLRSDSASVVDHLYLQNRNGGSNSGARIAFSNGTVDYGDNRYAYIGAVNTGASESGNHLVFATNANGGAATEKARIDSSGRLLVGTNTARTNFFNSASLTTANLQLEGIGYGNRFVSITSCNSSGSESSCLILAHQKSGTVGGNTVLASGDSAGLVSFQGSDGSNFVETARIESFVDGAPGAGDMPGRLVFSTTADGASSPTERLRITSNGYVRLASGTGGIQFNGDTAAANALDDYEEGTFTPTITQGVTSLTYDTANTRGTYRIIGKQLFFTLRVKLTSGTTDSNTLRVGGLPVNPSLDPEYKWVCVGHFQNGASNTLAHCLGYNNSPVMDIHDSSDRTVVTGTEATNTLDLQITGTYPIA